MGGFRPMVALVNHNNQISGDGLEGQKRLMNIARSFRSHCSLCSDSDDASKELWNAAGGGLGFDRW